jgi:hypothetical protein
MNRQSTDTQENMLIEAAEWLRFLSDGGLRRGKLEPQDRSVVASRFADVGAAS